jgi:hypothetical protein
MMSNIDSKINSRLESERRKKLFEEAGLDGRMIANAGIQMTDQRLIQIIESKKIIAKEVAQKNSRIYKTKKRVTDFFSVKTIDQAAGNAVNWFKNIKIVKIINDYDRFIGTVDYLKEAVEDHDKRITSANHKAARAARDVNYIHQPTDAMIHSYVERLRLVKETPDGPLVIRGLTQNQLKEEKEAEHLRAEAARVKKEAAEAAEAERVKKEAAEAAEAARVKKEAAEAAKDPENVKKKEKKVGDFDGVKEVNTPMTPLEKPNGDKRLKAEQLFEPSVDPETKVISSGINTKTPNLDTSKDGYDITDSPFS